MDGVVIVENLIQNLTPWWQPIKLVGYLIGLGIVGAGLASFVSGGRGQPSNKGAIISIVAGIVLLNIMSLLDAISMSLLNKASETGLDYQPAGDGPEALYIQFAIYLVMLVGFAGVIYGCVLLKRSAEDGRQLGAAITHMIGGTMAVNIVEFLNMLGASMGHAVEGAVKRIIGG